jgi:hypothetical protein
MSKEFLIRKIMMSNDVDRDLYELKDMTECPNPMTEDFYGEIILWLSYENEDGSEPSMYWNGGHDYVNPNFTTEGINGISTDAAKIGVHGLKLYNTTFSFSFGNISDYNDIANTGTYGTWFRITNPGFVELYPTIISIGKDETNFNRFGLYNGEIIIELPEDGIINTGFSPTTNTWYFLEYIYSLKEHHIVLNVYNDEEIIYTFSKDDISSYDLQADSIVVSYSGTAGEAHLDNSMLSTSITKSLYPVRNLTSCPKGPRIE